MRPAVPALARTTVSLIWADLRSGNRTPTCRTRGPLRKTAPKLFGSVTRSRAMINPPFPRVWMLAAKASKRAEGESLPLTQNPLVALPLGSSVQAVHGLLMDDDSLFPSQQP